MYTVSISILECVVESKWPVSFFSCPKALYFAMVKRAKAMYAGMCPLGKSLEHFKYSTKRERERERDHCHYVAAFDSLSIYR